MVKLLSAIALLFLSFNSHAENCIASGNTVHEARDNYALQCTEQREDCDPFSGTWYCANTKVDEIPLLELIGEGGTVLASIQLLCQN